MPLRFRRKNRLQQVRKLVIMKQKAEKEGKDMAKNIDISVAGRIDALNNKERRYTVEGKEFKRGNSWIYCHRAFSACAGKKLNDRNYDDLALQLAFYLASWGMYRGSSFLLNMDYKIHIQPVKMMMEKQYRRLFACGNPFADEETAQAYKKLLFDPETGIYRRIEEFYIKAHRAFANDQERSNESDTLLTKILLGVYGCIPAYDRYFRKGMCLFNRPQFLNQTGGALFHEKRGLGRLLAEGALKEQLENYCRTHEEYTFMKVVDMYFFSLGVAVEEEKADIDTMQAHIQEQYA